MNSDEQAEEEITRGLYAFYRAMGHSPGEALQRLAGVLAWHPAMFTRMVLLLDELREEQNNDLRDSEGGKGG